MERKNLTGFFLFPNLIETVFFAFEYWDLLYLQKSVLISKKLKEILIKLFPIM